MSGPAQSSAQSSGPRPGPREGLKFEDLSVGMTASLTKTVTEADVVAFADISGDRNPLHLDAAYAAGTIFKQRIAHGMLSAAFISAVFGESLPGPGAIYVAQNLKFRAPVKFADAVTARVEIIGLVAEKNLVQFKTQCLVGTTVVIDGEATLLVPSRG
jgi:3-hydroxybutyryl-CoA dehydratase